jgi:superfamily II DNA/RNA helicase
MNPTPSDPGSSGPVQRSDQGHTASTGRSQVPDEVPSRDEIATEYFSLLPFPPYPVQEEALLAYFTSDQGVLVCAPTGTGKTLIAEAAVYEALRTGSRMYYTTPLIALTDQKLDELRQSAVRWGFDANSIGLVTGNRTVNPQAPVLVVVAEILLNRLLNREVHDMSDVSAVVMDEFHSFNDPERGVVWELTLGLLEPSVRTLLLSATVGNSVDFTAWLARAHNRRLTLVQGTERKVPLQFEWVEDELLADFCEQIATGTETERRTPALIFCFNRSICWTTAEMLRGKSLIDKARQADLADYLNAADMREGAGPKLKQILMRGVGVHHAGILPRYRRIVEELFQRKWLAVCVCTETLAAGINLPARSVVLPSLLKGPPGKKKVVEAATAHQIFGRAGRPQFDDRGFVYALAHEDDVKIHRWRLKYDQIPEDTKDPGLMQAKKALKKKQPKRRTDEQYWTKAQFESLREAPSAKLASRGRLPWRLLAYLLLRNPEVQPIRDLVGRRLLDPKGLDEARRDLNRMLITLWISGYIKLEPKPKFRAPSTTNGSSPLATGGPNRNTPAPAGQATGSASGPASAGLFGELLAKKRAEESAADRGGDAGDEDSDDDEPQTVTRDASSDQADYEVDDYRPEFAEPTERLPWLLQLRSVHPLYGVYMADQLAVADPEERILAFESVLEVPGSVAKFVRVPGYDQMPAGTLAQLRLDPRLLQLGLATAAELGAMPPQDEEETARDRGFGRVFDEGPPVRPLTLGEKLRRLFQFDYPSVHDVSVTPVWVAGELREFNFDFNKYVTARGLQKEEGILFRHLLRLILLLDEMANIPPIESTVETWEYQLDDLAEALTTACRQIDPQSTDEILQSQLGGDDLSGRETGRRK